MTKMPEKHEHHLGWEGKYKVVNNSSRDACRNEIRRFLLGVAHNIYDEAHKGHSGFDTIYIPKFSQCSGREHIYREEVKTFVAIGIPNVHIDVWSSDTMTASW